MDLGIGLGIPFKNLRKYAYYYGVSSEPCLTNISQWFGKTYEDSGLYYQTDLSDPIVPIPLESACVQFNGTDNYLSFADLTGITIVSYLGDAIPTINGNDINYTAGESYYLELSNGSYYVFAENKGLICYDKINGLDATIEGTFTNTRILSLNTKPNNLIDGYNIGINSEFVPTDPNNLGFDVLGDPIVYVGIGETGTGHNMCETTYTLEHYGEWTITELINLSQVGVRIFYELTSGEEYTIKVDKIVTYDPNENAPFGDCLEETQRYCRMFPQYALADNTGVLLVDKNGYYMVSNDWMTYTNPSSGFPYTLPFTLS